MLRSIIRSRQPLRRTFTTVPISSSEVINSIHGCYTRLINAEIDDGGELIDDEMSKKFEGPMLSRAELIPHLRSSNDKCIVHSNDKTAHLPLLYTLQLLCHTSSPPTSDEYYALFESLPDQYHSPYLTLRAEPVEPIFLTEFYVDDYVDDLTSDITTSDDITIDLIHNLPTIPASSRYYVKSLTSKLDIINEHRVSGVGRNATVNAESYLEVLELMSTVDSAHDMLSEDWPVAAKEVESLRGESYGRILESLRSLEDVEGGKILGRGVLQHLIDNLIPVPKQYKRKGYDNFFENDATDLRSLLTYHEYCEQPLYGVNVVLHSILKTIETDDVFRRSRNLGFYEKREVLRREALKVVRFSGVFREGGKIRFNVEVSRERA